MNYYNDSDRNACAWLAELIAQKLIPDGKIDQRSILDVRASDLTGFVQCHFFCGIAGWPEALRVASWPEDRPVWTGSAPCQPFSVAGTGRGTADERQAMTKFAGGELSLKLSQPLKFQYVKGGGDQPFNGFDATILVDLCRVIIQADEAGAFLNRASRVVSQAHVILGASAKAGIKGLVYALAGYSPTAQEVIEAFKAYVQEEAKKYEKEFPAELYREWYRLYEIPPIQGRGRPWHFKKLTVEHIYTPLAMSNGKILELTRAQKASDGKAIASLSRRPKKRAPGSSEH